MNIPMLKKVRAAILKRPRQFEMSSFFSKSLLFETEDGDALETPSHCGTAACIAGWAIHIEGGLKTPKETYERNKDEAACLCDFYDTHGAHALGLSSQEGARLFYTSSWPGNFRKRYFLAKTPETRAVAAAARISHFIKTKGRE